MSEGLARRLGYLGGAPRGGGGGGARRREAAGTPPGEGWQQIGRWTWRRTDHAAAALPEGLDLSCFGCEGEARDLLFFDTETTGLSGGAGTLAFLIGLARATEEGTEVEQLFLADFPGEPELLEALTERLEQGEPTLVSYNGKCFDSHLLRSRFALVGREMSFARQIDLLYPVRKLWRRVLPECTLTSVAEAVLGIRRESDIPGAEVPEAYFEYLRRGEPGRLPLVFEHNRQDLLAMVGLLERIEALVGCRADPRGADATALGAWLLQRGDERGSRLLREALEAGDVQAGRVLGQHYKRRREWGHAVEIWERMAGSSLGDRARAQAAVELAKHAEHRLRQPERALQWLESAWPEVREFRGDDAERRRARLLAKVGRSA